VKVFVADDIAQLGIDKLSAIPNVQVYVQTGLKEAELAAQIGDYDALIVRSQTLVTAAVLEAAPNLRVIGRAGVGVDNIDVAAATRRGIVVVNAPDGNTISAAEHTFAMLISLSRHIPRADASVRRGEWDRKTFVGVELLGKTLAVLGTGRIGTEVAKRAQAFGMHVVGYDPFLTDDRAKSLGIERATLEGAIRVADFITVHTPLTAETRHMLNDAAFAKMKPGVRIINCARGGIIDEEALARALALGNVAGAAIDVFEHEPLSATHPLLGFANIVLTPHLGASTVEAQVNVAIDVAQEVGLILQGLPFHGAVNLPAMSGEQKSFLDPYLNLGEQLGRFAGQWLGQPVTELEVSYGGALAGTDVSFVTRTVLKGLFACQYGDEVNHVNAHYFAEQCGVTVREVKQAKSKVFNNVIQLTVIGETDSCRIVGTVYNGFGPRIVEIDGYAVDAAPAGKMLMTRHVDKPGMIGRIGTLLGNSDINIAGMHVGRREFGGEAVMVLNVDKTVSSDVVAEIQMMSGIGVVRTINL